MKRRTSYLALSCAVAIALADPLPLNAAGSDHPPKSAQHSVESDEHLPPAEPLALTVPPAPAHAVRPISLLRERIARGDLAAARDQGATIGNIADALRRSSRDDWTNQRNRYALIAFTLGGGDPAILRAVAEQGVFPEPEIALAQGTLAYAEGYLAVAAKALAKVDASHLPLTVAGKLSLVKAALIQKSDLWEALEHCRMAANLSPGTLVEEAALRLTIEIAAAADDPSRFKRAVERLMRRFPKSLYLSTVVPHIAPYLASTGMDDTHVQWLKAAMLPLGGAARLALIEAVAEQSLRRGNFSAVEALERLPDAGTVKRESVLATYGAIARTVSDQPGPGLDVLSRLPLEPMPTELAEAVAQARRVGEIIAGQSVDVAAEAVTTAGEQGEDPATEMVAIASKALSRADELLKATRR